MVDFFKPLTLAKLLPYGAHESYELAVAHAMAPVSKKMVEKSPALSPLVAALLLASQPTYAQDAKFALRGVDAAQEASLARGASVGETQLDEAERALVQAKTDKQAKYGQAENPSVDEKLTVYDSSKYDTPIYDNPGLEPHNSATMPDVREQALLLESDVLFNKSLKQADALFDEVQSNIALAQNIDQSNVDAKSIDLTDSKPVSPPQAKQQTQPPNQTQQQAQSQNLGSNQELLQDTTSQQAIASESGTEFNPDDYLPTYERDENTAADPYALSASQEKQDKKPNVFVRLYNKWFGDDVGSIQKISVTSYFTDSEEARQAAKQAPVDDLDALAKNVERALSQVSVDEFDDFRLVIPRLRSIARDAAKAVGFYEAEFFFERSSPTGLKVTITPNHPMMIRTSHIQVVGDAADDEAFKKILSEEVLAVGKVFNHGVYSEVKQALSLAAQNQGYFDARFTSKEVVVVAENNTAEVSLIMDSGKRYRFGEVLFLGKTGKPYLTTDLAEQIEVNEKLLKQLIPFEADEYFTQEKVNEFARRLLATQYFNAVDVQVLKPKQVSKQESNLSFDATEDTQASAALPKDDSRLKRAVQTVKKVATDAKPKDVIVPDEDTQKQQEIDRLMLRAQADQQKKVPIQVSLDSSHPNSAEIGLGYGTDTEFRVRGQVSRNLLNKKGHSISADVELSKVRQAIELNYKRPFKDPLDDTLSLFTGYERNLLNGLDAGSLELSTENIVLGAQRNVLVGDWENSFSLTYRAYRLDIDQPQFIAIEEDYPVAFRDSIAKKDQQALLLGYRVNRASIKGGLYPYEGYKQYYQVELGSEDVLSDANMVILRAGFSGLYSFGEDRRHGVVARVDGGTFITDDFIAVPYNLRFFAGGDRSIRGYDYKSLSPTDEDYLLGGENLAVGSFEYNYAIFPKWRAAVFADVGNAYDADFKNETKIGAGVGVRWASPVGPVRIDVATGVKEDHHPVRIHFFIGPPL